MADFLCCCLSLPALIAFKILTIDKLNHEFFFLLPLSSFASPEIRAQHCHVFSHNPGICVDTGVPFVQI